MSVNPALNLFSLICLLRCLFCPEPVLSMIELALDMLPPNVLPLPKKISLGKVEIGILNPNKSVAISKKVFVEVILYSSTNKSPLIILKGSFILPRTSC